MRHLPPALALLACSPAEPAPTPTPPPELAAASGTFTLEAAPEPAVEAEEVGPLPHGIGPEDAYRSTEAACDAEAEKLASYHQRRGVAAYCKRRAWYAWRGAHPRPWTDGSLIHTIDMAHAAKAWDRAHRAGWIDPERCPDHARKNAVAMFTRGWFDVSLSLNGHWLATEYPIPCWSPWLWDRIDVGARVVVARSIAVCGRHWSKPCTLDNISRWWRERK